MARSERPLLSPKQFERLRKAPKAEVLAVLEQYVRREAGRPKGEQPALTIAERVRLYRERQREAKQIKESKPIKQKKR